MRLKQSINSKIKCVQVEWSIRRCDVYIPTDTYGQLTSLDERTRYSTRYCLPPRQTESHGPRTRRVKLKSLLSFYRFLNLFVYREGLKITSTHQKCILFLSNKFDISSIEILMLYS